MNEIAFVGLGAMGAPMAWNVSEEFSLRVHNRSEEKTEPFRDEGIPAADSPRDAAEGADAVIVMVPDSEALHAVLDGDDGVAAGLAEDEIVVNMSTVSPEATAGADEIVTDAGGRFVDSPVSGTVGPAEQGTLTVLAGGPDDLVDEVEPLLSTMGEPVVRCGDVGQGTHMKLAINLLLGDLMESFAEMLTFGTEQDLDFETMVEVVESSGLSAPLFSAKAEKIRGGDFSSDFPLDYQFKDLSLALDVAGDSATPLPATAASREAANAARSLGHGEEDMSAVLKYFEAVTEREIGPEN